MINPTQSSVPGCCTARRRQKMVAIDAGVGTNLWRRAKCDDRMKIRNRAGTARLQLLRGCKAILHASARPQMHVFMLCVWRESGYGW